uniref:Uncharacterized protein n=1 Tax=Triticum urartu TaxID=4572 RepID=A0A8R7PH20_TRIUA
MFGHQKPVCSCMQMFRCVVSQYPNKINK